ncbi:unnamed protein product [Closterium sp. NIES-64]|nr:unnamed protein product [Closterium sp. NIES-64]
MLLESPLEKWQAADLRDAGECARETVDLINCVLDLAKLQAGRLQLEALPLFLPRLVQQAVMLFRTRRVHSGSGRLAGSADGRSNPTASSRGRDHV